VEGTVMFGTVMKARLREGKSVGDMRALLGPRWDDIAANGGVWSEFGVDDKDPQVVIGVIHFSDRESYFANAGRPETQAQYEKMMELLDGPPEWTDVNWVAMAGTPKQLSAV